MTQLYEADAVLLVGDDPTEQNPLVAWQIRSAIRHRGSRLYVINSKSIKLLRKAKEFAEVPQGGEAAAVALACGRRRAVDPGTEERLSALKAALEKESNVVIVFGAELTGAAVRDLVKFGSSLPGQTRYMALGDYANSRGASDMGLLPDMLPGYVPVGDAKAREKFGKLWGAKLSDKPGLDARGMLAAAASGKLRALYVVGANPVKTFGVDATDRLGKLDLLIVQDLFLTETAKLADIVLPAASAYEKNGTMTNTAGEVQLVRKGGDVMGTRSDFDILRILSHQLAQQGLGQAIRLRTPEAAFDEIRQSVAGYDVSMATLTARRSGTNLADLDGQRQREIRRARRRDFFVARYAVHQRKPGTLLRDHSIPSGSRQSRCGSGGALVNEFAAQHPILVVALPKIVVVLFVLLTALAYLTWFERKVVAHIQARWGPYRVGPHGLLQPLADGVKFLFKEDVTPAGADKFAYFLAPFLALSLAITSIAVIPFGPKEFTIFGQPTPLAITNLNIGLLILFAITSMGVYGVALAGWSSNSKYPLLGGLRSSAQMVSYELALTMSVVGVILMAGTFNLSEIVTSQQGFHWGFVPRWNLIGSPMPQVLGFLLFFTSAVAETNRAPFDLAEAESELVAGLPHRVCELQVRDVFHGRICQHDHGVVPGDDSFLWRMAVALSADRDVGPGRTTSLPSAFALAGLALIIHGVRYLTVFGRVVLPVLGLVLCALALLLQPAGSHRFHSGTVLVPAENCDFSFCLRLGARHASPLPLRPVDGLRLEAAAAAFDFECGDHEFGDCA